MKPGDILDQIGREQENLIERIVYEIVNRLTDTKYIDMFTYLNDKNEVRDLILLEQGLDFYKEFATRDKEKYDHIRDKALRYFVSVKGRRANDFIRIVSGGGPENAGLGSAIMNRLNAVGKPKQEMM